MSMRQDPVTSDVLTTFDEVRDRLMTRLAGLSDAEYLWEPVPDCLTVRVGPDGVVRADDRPGEVAGRAPFATIAWRAWHIGSDCLRGYRRFFGEVSVPAAQAQLWPVTAEQGVAALAEDLAGFRARIASLGDARLIAPMGPPAAPYDADSFLALATHAIDETAHHGAEIALLRDLRAHGMR